MVNYIVVALIGLLIFAFLNRLIECNKRNVYYEIDNEYFIPTYGYDCKRCGADNRIVSADAVAQMCEECGEINYFKPIDYLEESEM